MLIKLLLTTSTRVIGERQCCHTQGCQIGPGPFGWKTTPNGHGKLAQSGNPCPLVIRGRQCLLHGGLLKKSSSDFFLIFDLFPLFTDKM